MKKIYSYMIYVCLTIIFIFGITSINSRVELSLKNTNNNYIYAGLSVEKNKELQKDSLKEDKENQTSKTTDKDIPIPPPSPSDLNRVEAISIDKYAPILFVFAIILIVYYARNSKKKDTP